MRNKLYAAAVLVLFGMGACQPKAEQSQMPKGQLAPDFSLPVLDSADQTQTLSQWTGDHHVLLIFWATWCPSCIQEIPVLNEWQGEYRGAGLKIFGINVKESEEEILKFIKKNPIQYPILLDTDGEVAARYGLAGLPAAVMLAKGGKIIYYGFGLPEMDGLIREFSTLPRSA